MASLSTLVAGAPVWCRGRAPSVARARVASVALCPSSFCTPCASSNWPFALPPVRAAHAGRHKFVDKARVQVIGGRGGRGLISFESIDPVRKRPMGGNGGRGGGCIIQASASVQDLAFPTFVIRGRDGGDATGQGNNGRAGKDKLIMVPVGTLVKEVDRQYIMDDAEAWAEEMTERGHDDTESSADDDDEYTVIVPGRGSSQAEVEADEQDDDEGRGRRRRGRRVPSTGGVTLEDDSLDVDNVLDVDNTAPAHAGGRARRVHDDAQEDGHGDAQEDALTVHTSKSGLMYTDNFRVLADLSVPGQSLLVARGGAPGVGNKASQLRVSDHSAAYRPHISGQVGEVRYLEFELKVIADVGLVGFPNAGKSSFLGAISKVGRPHTHTHTCRAF